MDDGVLKRLASSLLTQERSTRSSKGRDNIVLSIYANLHNGYEEDGVYHKIETGGAAYDRYVELCKKRIENRRK